LHVVRALHCMVVLRHVHGYTLAPSYNHIGYQTKNIREVYNYERDLQVLQLSSIKFSRPVYKINSKTMITSYIAYNLFLLFVLNKQI
jgi:hypothetical protein